VATARVEVQLRTVAMDFWASLEHKIFYKWHQHVPTALREELAEAARSASALDQTMQRLHSEARSRPLPP
jgi:putative GTP pyrophosphokinase